VTPFGSYKKKNIQNLNKRLHGQKLVLLMWLSSWAFIVTPFGSYKKNIINIQNLNKRLHGQELVLLMWSSSFFLISE
jgi:hypothetical protein